MGRDTRRVLGRARQPRLGRRKSCVVSRVCRRRRPPRRVRRHVCRIRLEFFPFGGIRHAAGAGDILRHRQACAAQRVGAAGPPARHFPRMGSAVPAVRSARGTRPAGQRDCARHTRRPPRRADRGDASAGLHARGRCRPCARGTAAQRRDRAGEHRQRGAGARRHVAEKIATLAGRPDLLDIGARPMPCRSRFFSLPMSRGCARRSASRRSSIWTRGSPTRSRGGARASHDQALAGG